MSNTFNLLSKWRNFAESGHTGTNRRMVCTEGREEPGRGGLDKRMEGNVYLRTIVFGEIVDEMRVHDLLFK